MMIFKTSLAALGNAWEMLLDPACPHKLSDQIENADPDLLPELTIYAFPVLGFILGLCAIIVGKLTGLLPNPIAGAFLFSLICTLGFEYCTSGRSVGALASFVELRFEGLETHEALLQTKPDFNVSRTPAGMLTMITVLLIKAVCFFVLYQKSQTIVIAGAIMLSYTAQAALASMPLMTTGESVLEGTETVFKRLWMIAVILLVIVFISAPGAALTGLICCVLLVWLFRRICTKDFDGMINVRIIGIAGTMVELTALFAGFLFIR
jgi:cobalamin synthase